MRKYDAAIQRALGEAEAKGVLVRAGDELPYEVLTRRVRSGELVQPYPGMFARASSWQSGNPRSASLAIIRTLATAKPELCFCHVSAAALYGLQVSWRELEVPVVATNTKCHTQSTTHLRRLLVQHDEPCRIAGIRVTSPEQTVFDCIRLLGFDEAVAVADSALRTGVVGRASLREFIERRAGVPGVCQARRVIAFANPLAENGGESAARATMYRLGFEVPDLQFEVFDDIGSQLYRADFHWSLPDSTELFGELDGREKYVDPEMTGGRGIEDVLTEERRREARLTRKGAVMRFSMKEVRDRSYFEKLLDAYQVPRARRKPQLRWRTFPQKEPA